jgi:hypothetical protein
MSRDAFSITQEQVDEILASAHAIGRHMEYLAGKAARLIGPGQRGRNSSRVDSLEFKQLGERQFTLMSNDVGPLDSRPDPSEE